LGINRIDYSRFSNVSADAVFRENVCGVQEFLTQDLAVEVERKVTGVIFYHLLS
jgi:hypothetical protein